MSQNKYIVIGLTTKDKIHIYMTWSSNIVVIKNMSRTHGRSNLGTEVK